MLDIKNMSEGPNVDTWELLKDIRGWFLHPA